MKKKRKNEDEDSEKNTEIIHYLHNETQTEKNTYFKISENFHAKIIFNIFITNKGRERNFFILKLSNKHLT